MTKTEKIIAARIKLRERYEAKMRNTPSLADDQPHGSGPTNRHGMPELPIGQIETKKWPVLDLGYKPAISPDRWRLFIDGEVAHPQVLKWADFMDLPQTEDVSDFHCVTTWSRLNVPWAGVRMLDLAALAQPTEKATHVMFYSYDTYATNLPLEEALKPDVLVVHTADHAPLPLDHGGPARVVVPQLYAWKGAKWIKRIHFMAADKKGFWEERGYSNTAYPWRDDRYE